jgi:hypothetical protein
VRVLVNQVTYRGTLPAAIKSQSKFTLDLPITNNDNDNRNSVVNHPNYG